MKIILYICIWIVGGNCPMKVDSRTPFPDTFVRDNLKSEIMKEIQLNKGFVTQVDDEDFEWLNQMKWTALKGGKTFYAYRSNGMVNGKQKHITMHQMIMNPPKGMEPDHIDHDGLNNQRYNLRNGTHSQNNCNKTPCGMSKYLGVSFIFRKSRSKNNDTVYKYIIAQMTKDKKHYNLGTFKTEEDAARAYDKAAKELHGEFANLNFKD